MNDPASVDNAPSKYIDNLSKNIVDIEVQIHNLVGKFQRVEDG
jgi:predicted FMN-binding regulatory protein PaiB